MNIARILGKSRTSVQSRITLKLLLGSSLPLDSATLLWKKLSLSQIIDKDEGQKWQ